MPTMNFPPLEELMPHRRPMILLDRLVEAGETTAICEVDIRAGVPFSDATGVPSYVGIEYMAQTIAVFSGCQRRNKGEPIEVGFLLGTPRFTSYCAVFQFGTTLRVQVTHVWGEQQLARFECSIQNAQTGQLLQKADLSVFKPQNMDAIMQGLNK